MTARRSTRGAGSLQQIAPGRWRSQGTDPTGRRRSAIHHVGTKREAVEAHQRFMVQIGAEDSPGPGTKTFGDLLTYWWKLHSEALEDTSRYRYQLLVDRTHACIGSVPLGRITPMLLSRLYAGELQPPDATWDMTPYAAHDISGKIVNQALDEAVNLGWLTGNPNRRARRPKLRTDEIRPPTLVEVDEFTRKLLTDGPPYLGILLHLASRTGARKGELLGLQWDDIGPDSIHIRRSVFSTPETGVKVKAPKTARSRRQIAIDDPGTAVLLQRWRTMTPGRWVFPGDPIKGDLPLSPHTLDRNWAAAKKRYGYKFRLHDVRHAVATHLLSGGIPLPTVSEFLGHNKSDVTLRTYAHALPQDHRAAAALLSGIAPTGDARP